MPFAKGQSGNPGGRPKGIAELKEIAQQNAPKAINKLIALIDSADERVALAASEAVLNRGYGKPPQAIEHTGKDGGPIQTENVSALDHLESRISGIAARSGTNGSTSKPH